jgi:UDP-N-acetylmuramyl pentapeptide phosphotransferase/UDP-N-acetylglucosamine-1-phosphate transferase
VGQAAAVHTNQLDSNGKLFDYMQMNTLAAITIAGAAFVASYFGLRLLLPILRRYRIVDVPNARSSHAVTTPRGGGLAILAGIAAGLGVAGGLGFPIPPLPLLAGAGIVAAIGLVDDCTGGLPVFVRLAVQLGAASWVVASTGGMMVFPLPAPADIVIGPLGPALAVFWILAVCNIFNFLDGMDGYAGTQALIAGAGYMCLGANGNMTAGLTILGGCAAFLIHNWHPAKIFMGDVGSAALGFLIAGLPFGLPSADRERVVFAVGMFLWFFLADGTFTLCARIWRREKIWKPHRQHLYQRLMQAGKRPDKLVVKISAACLTITCLAVVAYRTSSVSLNWVTLAGAVIGFAGYVLWTRTSEERLRSNGKPVFIDRARITGSRIKRRSALEGG